MSEEELKYDPELDVKVYLHRMTRELVTIRRLVSTGINDMINAESEVPEKMRRYMNYMHDVHDVKYMYEEQGHPVPQHILRELERLDDRYRHLLKELFTDGGAFEQVRREMAKEDGNRWDHSRQLTFSGFVKEESSDEAR